jgi:hypothetical protein
MRTKRLAAMERASGDHDESHFAILEIRRLGTAGGELSTVTSALDLAETPRDSGEAAPGQKVTTEKGCVSGSVTRSSRLCRAPAPSSGTRSRGHTHGEDR